MDNYIKQKPSGTRIQTEICDKQVLTELSADVSLPDYLPEIKRLLRVSAVASPPDKYIGAGSVECSGRIDYSILYSGNDGALYCASEAGEYKFNLPLEMNADYELNEGLVCDVDTLPDTTVGRVAAPRKLSLKCRLRSRIRIRGIRLLGEQLQGEDTHNLQLLCGQVDAARVFVGIGEPLTLGDEILTDSDSADLRVVSADAEVFVNEAVSGSGVVNCRGEVCLKLLCCHESTPLPTVTLSRRIPFSHSVDVDGVEVNCDASADGLATDLHVTVEDGRILCEAVILLRARAQRNEQITYTRDLYSTASDCQTRKIPLTLSRAERCLNGNFSLNTTLTLEEAGIRSGQSPIDVTLTPTVSALECDSGKTVLCGRCRVSAILFDGEDVSAHEFELPFRYRVDCERTVTDFDASVTPISCRARVDGERIAIDAELAVSLITRSETSINPLVEATVGEKLSPLGAVMTVCYPSRDDTLWSVAKRYHRPVSEISLQNGLSGAPSADSPDSLAGVSFLVV